MARTRWRRIAVLLLLAGAAPRSSAAQSDGATDWFGRGIARVKDEGNSVQLDLRVAAQGLLLRLTPGEPVAVVAVGTWPAGRTLLRIPPRPAEEARGTSSLGSFVDPGAAARQAERDRNTCIARRTGPSTDNLTAATIRAECTMMNRTPVPQSPRVTSVQRAARREHLLLVLSDQPLDVADLNARLALLPPVDLETAAHDVADFLVGRRSPMWAGYLVRR